MAVADEKRLERIEKKIDDSNEHLAAIDKTLTSQKISLDYHIKRTDLLEHQVELMRKFMWMVMGAIAVIEWLGHK